jgi:hypothetical protein
MQDLQVTVKRKPGRPRKHPAPPPPEEFVELENGIGEVKEEPQEAPAQPKKRGRPRKTPAPNAALDPPVKRPRGRPPGNW